MRETTSDIPHGRKSSKSSLVDVSQPRCLSSRKGKKKRKGKKSKNKKRESARTREKWRPLPLLPELGSEPGKLGVVKDRKWTELETPASCSCAPTCDFLPGSSCKCALHLLMPSLILSYSFLTPLLLTHHFYFLFLRNTWRVAGLMAMTVKKYHDCNITVHDRFVRRSI